MGETIDPILASVLTRVFKSITDEMSVSMTNTTRSPILCEARDFVIGLDTRKIETLNVDICFMGLKGGSGAMMGTDGYDQIGMIDASGGVLDRDYQMFEQQSCRRHPLKEKKSKKPVRFFSTLSRYKQPGRNRCKSYYRARETN